MNIVDIASNNWGIIVAFVIGVIYVITHYKTSVAYARKKAVSLMLAAEKKAEDLLLTDGPAKFAWVVDKGYDLLPAAVRLFVSKPLFKTIVQALFDEAVAFAQAHRVQPAQQPQPPQQ
jgi:hypothetical protein